MGKGIETGKSFLEGVLSKIADPDLKARAAAVFADASVATEIGNGVEGQTEINRRLQELNTKTTEIDTRASELATTEANLTKWQTDLTDWRTVNNDDLTLGRQARAAKWDGKTPGGAAPVVATPAGGVTEDLLQSKMQELTNNLLGYDADKSELTKRHFETFKELLDIRPLLSHPKIREVGLKGVYDEVYKPKLEEYATTQAKLKEDAIRLDERTKVLASNASMPYPPVTGVSSGSPLDALKQPDGGGPIVDAAVTEYNRLQTARVGAGA